MTLRSTIGRIPGARRLRTALRSVFARRAHPVATPAGYDDSPDEQTRRDLRSLKITNALSRKRVVDPTSPVVVTMTTYSARIDTVYLAIESVARGVQLPFRHVLYLDDPTLMANLPRSLKRLRRRGLEIELVPAGYKVHTKHHFYVKSIAKHSMALATNEDDIIFPPTWLADLVRVHRQYPNDLVTPRAHRIRVDGDRVAPYLTWQPCSDDRPSYLNFGTTVSGQIYPPEFLDYVRDAGEDFLTLCPNNDDLWLHHLAVQSERRVVQTTPSSQHFAFVPGTQATGLYFTNVLEGGNDQQIAATYTAEDIETMRADQAASLT